MKQAVNIFWFRRDLRLDDNTGLFHALNGNLPVLPLFIFDAHILDKLPRSDARLDFIFNTLKGLNQQLQSINGSEILQLYDAPHTVFEQLLSDYDVKTVYTNHGYEPYAISRDDEIQAYLESNAVTFKSFKDQVIYERNDIVKKDGTPYKVYTPFMKKWKAAFRSQEIELLRSEDHLDQMLKESSYPQVAMDTLGFIPSDQKIRPYRLSKDLIMNYEATRNIPGQDSTSHVGPHLRFGTLSIRKVVQKAARHNNEIFLQELIWREFFMQVLWHFPLTTNQSFKPKYDRIQWRNNEKEFELWCKGKTGYPLVDAGMRELNATGFMHNRVRMLVGSFLCKHLLIDWRFGEAYFAEKLHDYEQASNIGNWQWVAGCGVDASPYFRIFNPTTQIKKFDKDLKYIHKWVPDLQEFTYPKPIVEHKFARERCLKVYKEALTKF